MHTSSLCLTCQQSFTPGTVLRKDITQPKRGPALRLCSLRSCPLKANKIPRMAVASVSWGSKKTPKDAEGQCRALSARQAQFEHQKDEDN